MSKYQSEAVQEYFGHGVTLTQALEAEIKERRSLAGAYLQGIQIQGNMFKPGPNLAGADLRGSNLKEARLSYGSLNGAHLQGANLESAGLGDVDIRNVTFWHTNLFNVKFRDNNFEGVKGLEKGNFRGRKWGFIPVFRMLEIYPEQCEEVYRSLIKYFSNVGALDDASWASYRERVTHHNLLRKDLSFFRVLVGIFSEDEFSKGWTRELRVYLLAIIRWVENIFKFIYSCLLLDTEKSLLGL